MKRQIWKFPLDRPLRIPKGGVVRHFGLDGNGEQCIWVEVDPAAEPVPRVFVIYGTGWDIDPDLEYVATFVDRAFVWHLYDLGESR